MSEKFCDQHNPKILTYNMETLVHKKENAIRTKMSCYGYGIGKKEMKSFYFSIDTKFSSDDEPRNIKCIVNLT